MSEETAFAVPLGERQLFIDDRGVASSECFERTMHRPVKKGAVIRPTALSGDLQTRNAPIWDPETETYRFWLTGGGGKYWESSDGLHWIRPYAGEEETKRCQVHTPEGERGFYLVVRDPDDAELPFKAVLPSTGFAASRDGVRWQLLEVPAIRTSDEQNISLDLRRQQFIYTFKLRGPYGRSVWLSTSPDFAAWSDPRLVFHADDVDQLLGVEHIRARLEDTSLLPRHTNDPAVYNVDVYNMGVFAYEGLYLGTPAMFHAVAPTPDGRNRAGFHLLQLVSSRDLTSWQRVCRRETFIGPSPVNSGAYDLTQIIGPSAPLMRDDELWFFYSGLKYRDDFPAGFKTDADGAAICLAVLRRDGFVSLDAGEEEGVLVTSAFAAAGTALCANFDARGSLAVEAVDDAGTVLATSHPLEGDQLRGAFEWKTGSWAGLQDRSVSLRFRARQAQLYSYWVE